MPAEVGPLKEPRWVLVFGVSAALEHLGQVSGELSLHLPARRNVPVWSMTSRHGFSLVALSYLPP